MLASIIYVPLVSICTGKSVPKDTDDMFKCFETKVYVPAKDVLIDGEGKAE